MVAISQLRMYTIQEGNMTEWVDGQIATGIRRTASWIDV